MGRNLKQRKPKEIENRSFGVVPSPCNNRYVELVLLLSVARARGRPISWIEICGGICPCTLAPAAKFSTFPLQWFEPLNLATSILSTQELGLSLGELSNVASTGFVGRLN